MAGLRKYLNWRVEAIETLRFSDNCPRTGLEAWRPEFVAWQVPQIRVLDYLYKDKEQ